MRPICGRLVVNVIRGLARLWLSDPYTFRPRPDLLIPWFSGSDRSDLDRTCSSRGSVDPIDLLDADSPDAHLYGSPQSARPAGENEAPPASKRNRAASHSNEFVVS